MNWPSPARMRFPARTQPLLRSCICRRATIRSARSPLMTPDARPTYGTRSSEALIRRNLQESKKREKHLDNPRKSDIIHFACLYRDCVKVARRTLTPSVRVRILLPVPFVNREIVMISRFIVLYTHNYLVICSKWIFSIFDLPQHLPQRDYISESIPRPSRHERQISIFSRRFRCCATIRQNILAFNKKL